MNKLFTPQAERDAASVSSNGLLQILHYIGKHLHINQYIFCSVCISADLHLHLHSTFVFPIIVTALTPHR